MKVLIIAALMMMTQCEKSVTAENKVAGVLNTNSLPVDGCEAHLTFDNDENTYYIPTAETRTVLDNALKTIQSNGGLVQKNVWVTYQATNQKGTLQCGWGAKQQATLITLLAIEPR